MKEQIHRFNHSATSYAIVSPGGPHALGALNILIEEGETTEGALARQSAEWKAKAARLLAWSARVDAAVAS